MCVYVGVVFLGCLCCLAHASRQLLVASLTVQRARQSAMRMGCKSALGHHASVCHLFVFTKGRHEACPLAAIAASCRAYTWPRAIAMGGIVAPQAWPARGAIGGRAPKTSELQAIRGDSLREGYGTPQSWLQRSYPRLDHGLRHKPGRALAEALGKVADSAAAAIEVRLPVSVETAVGWGVCLVGQSLCP